MPAARLAGRHGGRAQADPSSLPAAVICLAVSALHPRARRRARAALAHRRTPSSACPWPCSPLSCRSESAFSCRARRSGSRGRRRSAGVPPCCRCCGSLLLLPPWRRQLPPWRRQPRVVQRGSPATKLKLTCPFQYTLIYQPCSLSAHQLSAQLSHESTERHRRDATYIQQVIWYLLAKYKYSLSFLSVD